MADLKIQRRGQWKRDSKTQVEETMVTDCFNEKEIKTLRKTREKTQIEKAPHIQELIYQVLEQSDELQISEDQVFFEARGREKHDSFKIYLGSDVTLQDKEDLYTIGILSEMEDKSSITKDRSMTLENEKHHPQWKEKDRRYSKPEGVPELNHKQYHNQLEILSQILEVSEKDERQWRGKISTNRTDVCVQIHEGKVNGELTLCYQRYFCRMGLALIRDEKTKSKLDGLCNNVKTTNITEGRNAPKWDELIQLASDKENCLLVELWNEYTVKESKKKGRQQLKQARAKIGQCVIELGNQNVIPKKCYPIYSQDGKIQSGNITLSIEITGPKVMRYSAGHKYALYKLFLNEAVAYHISKFISFSFSTMEPSIECVRTNVANLLKLSEFERNAAEWTYVNSIEQVTESRAKIEFNLLILNSKWDSEALKMDPIEREKLLQEIHRLYKDNLDTINYILLKFPPRNEKALTQINQLFGLLLKLFLFLKDRKIISQTEEFTKEIKGKIKEAVYCWYGRTEDKVVKKESLLTYVHTLSLFCQHVIKFLQMLRKYYAGVAKLDFSQIALVTIDPLLAGEVELCIQKISQTQESDELIFSLFGLDRKIKLILKEKCHMDENEKELHLDFHLEWFRTFMVGKWLNILSKVSVECVDRVIKFETKISGVENEKLSSSAFDIAICLFPCYCFYAKMQEYLDTADRIHISFQVVLLIQETLMRYVQIMGVKISDMVAGSEKNGFKLTREICQILNNIHFVKEYLDEVPRKLNFKNETENSIACDSRYLELIKEAEECLHNEKLRVLSAILPHFDTQIKKYCKSLTSVLDTSVEDVIGDLMNWLMENIQISSTQFTQAMFNEFLEILWVQVLENINVSIKDESLSKTSYDYIFKAINILYEFFYNDGEGLPIEKIKKKLYLDILKQIRLEMVSSYHLMLECVQEFAKADEKKYKSYGGLTFSMVYYDDREILETTIMYLKDCKNPSFTGKFKPIIELSVLPKCHNIEVTRTGSLNYSKDIFINQILTMAIPKHKFSNTVLKISLFYRDILGIRDECYSGAVHVDGESIGHCSSNLKDFVNQTDKKVGGLVKRNFIYPFNEDNEIFKILRKRKDTIAQSFLKEMLMEQKKEQSLNKYQSGVDRFLKVKLL
ncbi:BAI1-associated protein 3-like [Oopsacas minuta]|uniref:BAI1-associated protein 3-like n=1 Tax=Oopsacas minuta TaxID=111878 RepID=A0AAV7K2D0_9METZ|nr:BAI1-associated protein 3-like [Oopsacas minuta]